MSKMFAPNIEKRGRLVRGVTGVVLLAAGACAGLSATWWLGVILLGCGAFTLFEAVRGWCILRACGIKTRL